MTKPICYILVGLPGSGKSTWAKNYNSSNGLSAVIISSDSIIDYICDEFGISYDMGWSKLIDFANMIFNKQLDDWLKSNCDPDYDPLDIIIDRTNLTKKSRKNIIDRFKKDYTIIVKEFWIDEDLRKQRCADRIGKTIPDAAIERMKADYEPFTEDELL